MSSLKLTLFGSPQIELDGERVTFKTRKALALLAYLTLETDTIHGSHITIVLEQVLNLDHAHSLLPTDQIQAIVLHRSPLAETPLEWRKP